MAALAAGFIRAIQLAGLTITYILSLIYSAESDYSPAREVKPVRQADSATRQGGRAEPGLANLVLPHYTVCEVIVCHLFCVPSPGWAAPPQVSVAMSADMKEVFH